VALVLYGPPLLVFLVVEALTLVSLLEYGRLSAPIYRGSGAGALAPFLGLLIPLSVYLTGRVFPSLLLPGALLVFIFASAHRAPKLRHALPEAAVKTMGLLYISLPLSTFILLGEIPRGRLWILFFLIIIWCNDSFAYLTGKLLGRHKLSPSISPGKTIEGAVGGITSGIIAALVFNAFACLGGAGLATIAALVIGVLGIAGDLFESIIKRGAGVKDSGTIVPGHGGLLDRIDSMLFSLPAIYLLVIHLKI